MPVDKGKMLKGPGSLSTDGTVKVELELRGNELIPSYNTAPACGMVSFICEGILRDACTRLTAWEFLSSASVI